MTSKAWETRRKKYGSNGYKTIHPMLKPEVVAKIRTPEARLQKSLRVSGNKNPTKNPNVRKKISNTVTKTWKKKKENGGYWKNPKKRSEKISKALKGKLKNYQRGENNPSKRPEVREKISEKLKKAWVERKKKFGVTGVRNIKEYKRKLIERAVLYPHKNTSIEIIVQKKLKSLKVSFITQKSILGLSKVDIFIVPNICIFVDGCYWHGCPEHFPERVRKKDKRITKKLEQKGYIVLRFWGCEINNKLDEVVEKILLKIKLPLTYS